MCRFFLDMQVHSGGGPKGQLALSIFGTWGRRSRRKDDGTSSARSKHNQVRIYACHPNQRQTRHKNLELGAFKIGPSVVDDKFGDEFFAFWQIESWLNPHAKTQRREEKHLNNRLIAWRLCVR